MALEITPLDPADVDVLRPAWLALRDHHHTLTPDWGPVHDDDASWGRRRADYVKWLDEPDAFCLVARRDGAFAGYTLVTVNRTGPTWSAAERFGYVETLSVMPHQRGRGVGSALLTAAEDRLAGLGVVMVELAMVARNAEARRFYEREGYDVAFLTMQRRVRR